MIEFQASPVAQRTKVRNDAPKVWKLACLFISAAPSRSTRAKKEVPMIANMKMRRRSRAPKEPIAGSADINVLKICIRSSCLLIKRKTRQILSVRKIVPSISISCPIPNQARMIMIQVKNTIKKSNLFQLSLK